MTDTDVLGIDDKEGLPLDAPTDESNGRVERKMPGQGRLGKMVPRFGLATTERMTAPEGAPRKIDDIPVEFRKPKAPPGRKP